MSSGPNSGITNGGQTSFDQFDSELKAKENEDKVAKDLSKSSQGSKVSLPSGKSQLSHIFADRPGHLSDTSANRQKIIDLANNKTNYVGTDKHGNDWYSSKEKDGSQLWAKVHNQIVSDAGINNNPREFDPESGLNNNPKNNNTWRKKRK